MSFADFAGGNQQHAMPGGYGGRNTTAHLGAGDNISSKARQALDAATLKLEQFNRQVLAIKRAAALLDTNNARRNNTTNNTSSPALDDDLSDRIRFACLLQEELAKALRRIPNESSTALLQKKLCRDFEAISTQLEAAVVRISTHEQSLQRTLVAHAQDARSDDDASNGGRLVAEHQGRVMMFEAVEDLESEIAHNEAIIDERERDLATIHASVAQVHEIFRDLAAIVHEQQTAIDEVETNVHATLDQTQRGRDEVQKAADAQSRCVVQ